ncbi:MAG TPA: aminopeptidase [Sphingomicrobium sp.]|nr:aminopeptidase [Sphingomicrobium sp.]
MKRAAILASVALFLVSCAERPQGDAKPEDKAAAKADSDVDYDAIATRVVTESAGVKPGEIVVINGTLAEPKLLEALTGAVAMAGGHPIVTVDFPSVDKKFVSQAPEQYLRQQSRGELALIEAGDVFINASAVEDPALFADVDDNRLNIVREANQAVGQTAMRKRSRAVSIGQSGGIPTPAFAKSQDADYDDMRAMFLRALAVPAATIAERGRAVTGRMQPGSTVRLRTAEGTDLTFRLSGKPARVSTGRASDNDTGTGRADTWLPAGDYYACVEPNSASGVLVTTRQSFRGSRVGNLRITFQDGLATAITAESGGEALNRYLAQLDEAAKRMSLINIGLNPESRPLEGSHYLSWEMAGVPTVVLGNSQWAGCDHGAEDSFDVHLAQATLAAGDKPVVNNGALVLE